MTVKDLTALYEYSYWANAKVFPVVASLSDVEFTREVAGSFGSIRNTLVHMMSAEWGWLGRCGGPPRPAPLKGEDFPTFDSVAARWQTIEQQVRAFLGALADDDLARPITFSVPQVDLSRVMPLGELMHHAVNHNTHHRGQVALLLRALGHVPGNFDILFYYAERGVAA